MKLGVVTHAATNHFLQDAEESAAVQASDSSNRLHEFAARPSVDELSDEHRDERRRLLGNRQGRCLCVLASLRHPVRGADQRAHWREAESLFSRSFGLLSSMKPNTTLREAEQDSGPQAKTSRSLVTANPAIDGHRPALTRGSGRRRNGCRRGDLCGWPSAKGPPGVRRRRMLVRRADFTAATTPHRPRSRPLSINARP